MGRKTVDLTHVIDEANARVVFLTRQGRTAEAEQVFWFAHDLAMDAGSYGGFRYVHATGSEPVRGCHPPQPHGGTEDADYMAWSRHVSGAHPKLLLGGTDAGPQVRDADYGPRREPDRFDSPAGAGESVEAFRG